MSFLERIRATVNANLDVANVWFFQRESIVVSIFRRVLQTPAERLTRQRRTCPSLAERSPEEAFRDRVFAALFGVLMVSVAALWLVMAIRLFLWLVR